MGQNDNRPQQQQPQSTQRQQDIYVLIGGDETNNKQLRQLAAQKYPSARIVEELPLTRLLDLNSVCVVMRHPESGDSKLTEPLQCAPYWQEQLNGTSTIHAPTFLEELSKRITPKTVKLSSLREGIIKIGDV